MRGRQNWGRFFGSAPLNTEIRENMYKRPKGK
jgi:hypothetical protein